MVARRQRKCQWEKSSSRSGQGKPGRETPAPEGKTEKAEPGSPRTPSVFAKQNGRPEETSLDVSWSSQEGNRNRSICLGQKLLIPTFAAKQHNRNFAFAKAGRNLSPANHDMLTHPLDFRRFSPPGEMPPMIYGRQGGNHRTPGFPSVFAKQNGRPCIWSAKRGIVMIAKGNHYTTSFLRKKREMHHKAAIPTMVKIIRLTMAP